MYQPRNASEPALVQMHVRRSERHSGRHSTAARTDFIVASSALGGLFVVLWDGIGDRIPIRFRRDVGVEFDLKVGRAIQLMARVSGFRRSPFGLPLAVSSRAEWPSAAAQHHRADQAADHWRLRANPRDHLRRLRRDPKRSRLHTRGTWARLRGSAFQSRNPGTNSCMEFRFARGLWRATVEGAFRREKACRISRTRTTHRSRSPKRRAGAGVTSESLASA
jgi:hypothetical protein